MWRWLSSKKKHEPDRAEMAAEVMGMHYLPPDCPPPVCNAHYEACCNSMDGPATADLHHRDHLRDFSEELDNCNGYYSKALGVHTAYTVQSGPVLKITDERITPEDRAHLYYRWQKWKKASKFAACLREIFRGGLKTGEGLGKFCSAPRQRDPVKLKVKSVCCRRLVSPRSSTGVKDGIRFDENHDPVQFYLQLDKTSDPEELDAAEVLYFAYSSKEEQHRGLPAMHATLHMFPEIRDWRQSVLDAHKLWAKMPMWLTSDSLWIPQDEEERAAYRPSIKDEPFKLPHKGSYIPTLPNGADINSRQGEAPGTDAKDFLRSIVTEGVSPICMPALLIMGDAGECSFSAANVDLDPWEAQILLHRDDLEPLCTQTFDAWLIEAALIPGYLGPSARAAVLEDLRTYGHVDIDHQWRWGRVKTHMDPSKEADGRETDLRSGARTIVEVYEDNSRDPEYEWQKAASALGVSIEEYKRNLLRKICGEEERPGSGSQASRQAQNQNV